MSKKEEDFSNLSALLTEDSPYLSDVKPSKWQLFKDSWKPSQTGKVADMNDGSDLKKGMKKRQLQMIALGGCVGSGLLVASGKALVFGPASVLIAWVWVSTFLYCTMQSLAELSSYLPVEGSFAIYLARFIHPSWGFAMGWNYALFWVVVLPLELVAASMTINFWKGSLKYNNDAWIAIEYVLIIGVNLCGQRGFAETEFVASIIKLLGIVGFDIFGICMAAGATKVGYIGGKYWHDPGSFTDGFKGVVSVLITATYSLAGTELIGLTATESKENPRKIFPAATKQVLYRVAIFYVFSLALIGFLVPKNHPQLGAGDNSASPFVIALTEAGQQGLASVFNVVILVALLAIGNSAVYGFSRTMLGLAKENLAPKQFMYVDRKGRPLVGIGVCAFVGLLSFVAASPKQAEVFAWLMALSGLSTLFTWGSICGAHIQFRRALKHQGRSLEELPYVANTGYIGAWYGLFMNVLVLCFQFWISVWPIYGPKGDGDLTPSASYFFQQYLAAPIVLAFFLFHYLGIYRAWKHNWKLLVPVSQIDIDTGKNDMDVDMIKQEVEEDKQRRANMPWWKRTLDILFN